MLVLTRKLGESIYVSEDIKITIVRIKKGSVQVGIKAPDHLQIWREEIDPEPKERPKLGH